MNHHTNVQHVETDFMRDRLLSDFQHGGDYNTYSDESSDYEQITVTLPSPTQRQFGNGTLFAVTINYIVGTGVFSLPYAFYLAGLLLTGATLVVIAVVACLTAFYVLEVLSRAEGITRSLEIANAHADAGSNPPRPRHHITFRKFDYTRLCDVFASVPGRIFCQVILAGYCFGILLSYVSVFASTTSNLFYRIAWDEKCDIYSSPTPGCHQTYYVTLVIFAVIVLPLAWFDLPQQAKLQMFMTMYRLFAFSLMLITVGVGMFYPNPFVCKSLKADECVPGSISSGRIFHPAFSSLVLWGGYQYVFTSSAVALNMHYNIPDIIQPVRNKAMLRRVIASSILVVLFFYLTVGGLSATFFGHHTEPLVTLNWQYFSGHDGGWGITPHGKSRTWWAVLIQFLVMLFPVLDVISVFPLIGITLGNNLFATCPTQYTIRMTEKFGPNFVKVLFRGLATVPPIIASATLNQLDYIVKYTGLLGFFLQIFIPCVLQLWSRWWCLSVWSAKATQTPYSSHFSRSSYTIAALAFGVTFFLLALLNVIDASLIRAWFH